MLTPSVAIEDAARAADAACAHKYGDHRPLQECDPRHAEAARSSILTKRARERGAGQQAAGRRTSEDTLGRRVVVVVIKTGPSARAADDTAGGRPQTLKFALGLRAVRATGSREGEAGLEVLDELGPRPQASWFDA